MTVHVDRSVIASVRFEALHHWPGAVDHGETYLAFPHRHEFHIRAELDVDHDDRAIEFIELKRAIYIWLRTRYVRKHAIADLGTTSCEQLALDLALWLQDTYEVSDVSVEVLEDGENGGRVYLMAETRVDVHLDVASGATTFEKLEQQRDAAIAKEGQDLAGET